jgi:thioredoxin reductase (NADPH)
MDELYDIIIVGAGPAGMSAALYGARANKKVLIVEKECPGGTMLKAKSIDNYIGGDSDPFILSSNMFSQVSKLGVKYVSGSVVNIDESKNITLQNGKKFKAKTIIVATGGRVGNTNFKYSNYLNKGLSYCAVCDGSFYGGKTVAVIGNNDSVENTVDYLSGIVSNIYFINIEDKKSTKENVENFTNISNYEIGGKDSVEYIKIADKTYKIDGVFYEDNTNSFSGFVDSLEIENGYIKTNNNQETNLPGIYAAGDIVSGSVKQVVVAASQGAIAALSAIKYINKSK